MHLAKPKPSDREGYKWINEMPWFSSTSAHVGQKIYAMLEQRLSNVSSSICNTISLLVLRLSSNSSDSGRTGNQETLHSVATIYLKDRRFVPERKP